MCVLGLLVSEELNLLVLLQRLPRITHVACHFDGTVYSLALGKQLLKPSRKFKTGQLDVEGQTLQPHSQS